MSKPVSVGDAVMLGNYDGLGAVVSVNEARGVALVVTDDTSRPKHSYVPVDLGLVARSRDLMAGEAGA